MLDAPCNGSEVIVLRGQWCEAGVPDTICLRRVSLDIVSVGRVSLDIVRVGSVSSDRWSCGANDLR